MKGVWFFTNPQVDACCNSVTSTWALSERASLAYHPIKIHSLPFVRQDKYWPERPAQGLQCRLKSSSTLPLLIVDPISVYTVAKKTLFCVKNIRKRNPVYYYRLHFWFLASCCSICVFSVLLSGSKFWHCRLETTVKMWKPSQNTSANKAK